MRSRSGSPRRSISSVRSPPRTRSRARGALRDPCARVAPARAGGRGAVAADGAGAGPPARSRPRRRSGRGSRPALRLASSCGARRSRIGRTRPRLRRSASIASATPGCWTLTATISPSLVRASWTWPSDARANGSSSMSSNSRPTRASEVLLDHASHAAERDRRRSLGERPERREWPLAVGRPIELNHRKELLDLRPGALQPSQLGPELLCQRHRASVLAATRSLPAGRFGHCLSPSSVGPPAAWRTGAAARPAATPARTRRRRCAAARSNGRNRCSRARSCA